MRRNTSIYEVDRDSRNLYSPLCWGLVWLLSWKMRIWIWIWTKVNCWSAHCYALADGKMLLFKLRTSMDDTKINFSSMYNDLTYNLCLEDVIQDTSHLLYCKTLINNCTELFNDCSVEYSDIFKGTNEQLKAVKLYQHVFKAKQNLSM